MKKILLFAATIVAANLFSQTIPNNDFENWTVHDDPSSNVMVDSLEGGYFTSGNAMMVTLPSLQNGLPSGFMYDTTFAHSGNSAAAMRTGFLQGLVATGHMFSGKIDGSVNGIQSVLATLSPLAPAKTGVPSTETPSSFNGYYYYQPGNMYINYDTTLLENDTTFNKLDTCKIACLVHKWNSTLMQRDTIAYGEVKYHDSTQSFTHFSIPLDYYQTTSGDSISLLFLASAGGEFGFSGAPGTLLIMDSIYFEGDYLSLGESTLSNQKVYCQDNQVFIDADQNDEIIVVDLSGRKIIETVSSSEELLILPLYKRGIFIVNIRKSNGIIRSKKIANI